MDLKTKNQEWKRQGIFDAKRLGEMIILYKELGFDVNTEPVESIESGGETECSECIKEDINKYKVLYTKKL